MYQPTPVIVGASDIKNIGHTWTENESGNLSIIVNADTAGIAEILLRSILFCFGDNYRIIRTEDFFWSGIDKPDIEFITNLPWKEYESATE